MPIPVGVDPGAGVGGPGVPGAALHEGSLTLGDVSLGFTDAYGVEWILEGLSGWSDLPPSTGSVEQRAADHGAWYGSAYYGPRILEVRGAIMANSWADAGAALDRLWAAVPLSEPDWMYVDEGYQERQTLVRQDGDPIVERLNGWARFSLSLVAPDPRRYGAEVSASTGLPLTTGGLTLPITLPVTVGATTTSGLLSVVNEGNMPTRPVMAVTGPCPPFTITQVSTGRRLSALEAVPAGRTMFLDFDRRLALLDGTALRVVTGTWFELEPGTNDIQFNSSTYDAAAQLTVTFRSAWR